MDSNALNSVCKKIYQRFPEMKGVKPTIQNYSEGQVLLIFRGKVTTADGRELKRAVRVVATQEGKISKVSTLK